MNHQEANSLVPSLSIENLVAQRNTVAARIRDAHEQLQLAQEMAEALNQQLEGSGTMGAHDRIHVDRACFDHHGRRNLADEGGADDAIATIDATLWDLLLKESGMLSFMDAEARTKWQTQISEGNHPPLTKENIAATFATLMGGRGAMFDRGVVNMFRRLSWDFKTNNPVKYGKRLVITGFLSVYARGDYYNASLNHDACNRLDDLVRVMSVLDGKPEPDHRHGIYHSMKPFPEPTGTAEFTYFKIRWFKKGTAHLTFTQPALVDELNRIVAKAHPGALPPAR